MTENPATSRIPRRRIEVPEVGSDPGDLRRTSAVPEETATRTSDATDY
jgi:hypothetical protein